MRKVVVMGVSGCGKSTLGRALADALGCPLIEGDDYHLPSSRAKMSQGIALDDADREPWLDRLGRLLAEHTSGAVLTCSALKRRYRERLRAAAPGLAFVYIEISPDEAVRRVTARPGHFFRAEGVASQFEALEPPTGESGVVTVAGTLPEAAQCVAALAGLEKDDA